MNREDFAIDKSKWGHERPACLNFGEWVVKSVTLNEHYDGIKFSGSSNCNILEIVPVPSTPGKLYVTTDSNQIQHYVLENLFGNNWLERVIRKNERVMVDGQMLNVHLQKPGARAKNKTGQSSH
jgi:hypothetical protein